MQGLELSWDMHGSKLSWLHNICRGQTISVASLTSSKKISRGRGLIQDTFLFTLRAEFVATMILDKKKIIYYQKMII